MIFWLFLASGFGVVVGIDIGTGQFRAAIPNSSKSIFFLDSKESLRSFPTSFVIKTDKESLSRVLSPENVSLFEYEWLSPFQRIDYPSSTVIHPIFFLSKMPTLSFLKKSHFRKYYHESGMFNNQFVMTAGILPHVITTLTLRRISDKISEGGGDISQSVIVIPKYWLQCQREAIYYPAKNLSMKPLLIDSSTAMASYVAMKHKKFISVNPHCILVIDVGASSSQAMVFEFGRKEKILAQEIYYSWTDRVGGRDFDAVIANLIQKQTKGKIEPEDEVNRMIEAEKVKILLDNNEYVSNSYDGGIYNITRKAVREASDAIIDIMKDLINHVFKIIPIIEIDKVEVTGGGSKFFPIIPMIKHIFGINRVSTSSCPEEATAIGAAFLAAQKVQVNALPIYSLIVSRGNEQKKFNGDIPFDSGLVQISVENERIPLGMNNIIMSANVTKFSTITENPSHILKFKNSQTKRSLQWLQETMQMVQLINQNMIYNEKMNLARKIIEYEIGNYSDEVEESEILDEVMTIEERGLVEKELSEIKKWFEQNGYQASLEELLGIQDRTREIMLFPLLKKENAMFFDLSCDKMMRTLTKIENEIVSIAKLGKLITSNEFENYLRPLLEAKYWLEAKQQRQQYRDRRSSPIIWWFEVERKSLAIETMYKTIQSALLKKTESSQ